MQQMERIGPCSEVMGRDRHKRVTARDYRRLSLNCLQQGCEVIQRQSLRLCSLPLQGLEVKLPGSGLRIAEHHSPGSAAAISSFELLAEG